MNWTNLDDVRAQITGHGIIIANADGLVIDSPKPIRCYVEDDHGERRGWYWLNSKRLDDGEFITGAYGIYRGDDNGKVAVKINRDGRAIRISDADRAAIAARQKANMAALNAERGRLAAEAAALARVEWMASTPDGEHEYLKRKRVGAFGVRFSDRETGTLLVPMLDPKGALHGLQKIRDKNRPAGTREKEYWPKALAKTGHYHQIGPIPSSVVLLAEGYATAATLHQATGLPVVIAFDAGNLLAVGKAIKSIYKRARVVVCADDDHVQKCKDCKTPTLVTVPACAACGKPHGNTNPGITAAELAAHTLGGAVCVPVFAEARPTDRKGATDFNDLAAMEGEHVVRAQIEACLLSAGISVRAPARPDTNRGAGKQDQQGGGGRRGAVSTLPLDELVERFISIDDETGEFVFDTWTRSVCKHTKMIKMLPAGVRGDDIKRHAVWLERAVYIDQIGFDPAGEDSNIVCNRWNGWPTEPKRGECTLLLDLLEFLCAGESNRKELLNWILKWLAYPLQHPGAKMQSAIVIHGPQGTGKSRFFEAYAKIYGDYGLVLNQGAIEDKFNADWSERKLFILADEIVARADMYHLKNQLKNFITGEWVRVNPKNVAAHRERNHMNIVFSSNEKQPVILENDDRRHCVIWTPQKRDQEYYEEVSAEIDGGGVAALHDYLLNLDLGDFKPWTKPPMTSAKRDLIDISRDSADRFLQEWREGDLGLPFCPCGSADLYRAYLDWCRRNGERMPRPENQFSGNVLKLPGWVKDRKDIYLTLHYVKPAKRQRMVVPSSESLEEAAKAGVDDLRIKPGQNQTEWLTDCYLAFHSALDGDE